MPLMVDVYYAELAKAPAPISAAVTKVGGAPTLGAGVEWPTCRVCGKPMDFVAQFRLDEPLKLASAYTLASIFMCADDQHGTWAPNSGANAVLLQNLSRDAGQPGQGPQHMADYAVTFSPAQEPKINSSDRRIREEVRDEIRLETKLGGVPRWVQYSEKPRCPVCRGKTHFVAQLDEFWGEGGLQNPDLEFGDAGSSYVFICDAECSPRGAAFLWQCM